MIHNKIIGVLFGISIAILFIMIVITPSKVSGEIVNCYDRNNNLIVGSECIVTNGFESYNLLIICEVSFSITILILFSAVGYLLGSQLDEMEESNKRLFGSWGVV